MKRFLDIIISIFGILLLIPVSLGIWIANLVTKDNGPIFFKNKRIGLNGETIYIYKYRSMCMNAEQKLEELMASDPKIKEEYLTNKKLENDPRITKVGKFIRKTSIDELPQFYNVWKGDMSIVGPRPHMLKHTKDYSALIDKYMLRHTIKPGITGWAQVNGYRGQTDHLWQMEKRVEHDVWYAENWNLFLDMKIMFLTVWNVFKGEKNAY